jgi:hypothetical protein
VTPARASSPGASDSETTRRASSISIPSHCPTMTGRSRGLSAVTARENIDTATVAVTSSRACAARTTMSDAMEWPGSARRPSPTGFGVAGGDVRLIGQRAGGAVRLGDRAAERGEIAPMPGDIEGDRDIAIARGGESERLHQLLRAGEAMGDRHHRAQRLAHGGIDSRRDAIDAPRVDARARLGARQADQRLRPADDPRQRQQHEDRVREAGAQKASLHHARRTARAAASDAGACAGACADACAGAAISSASGVSS